MSDKEIKRGLSSIILAKSAVRKLVNKKSIGLFMITCIIIGASLFFLGKKLDEDGICRIKGRELTDEEIYVASMTEYFEQAVKFKEFHVAKMKGCRLKDWECELWIGLALNQKQVMQKVNASANFDTQTFISNFQLSVLDNLENFGIKAKLSINNNSFTFVSTINGIRILAQDCCRVHTYRALINTPHVDKVELGAINTEDRVDNKRFLRIDEYHATDVYSLKRDPNYSLSDARKTMTDNNRFYTKFLPVSACGKLKFNYFTYASDMPNPYDFF